MAVTADELRRAGKLLRDGGLVAFPTETVYGLGANALDADAVRKIYIAKGRPTTSPLIVHVDGVEMARSLTAEWPDAATRLAENFWPGPLTLVLPKKPHVPDIVTAGLPTVGIRVPSHPVALELIREAGVPIAAPSANPFTRLSPTTAEHVRSALSDRVDMILDGGPTTVGIESTVLSLATNPPMLLRPGMVSAAAIEQCIGPIAVAANPTAGPHESPGMHREHYQPRTPLIIGEPPAGSKSVYLYREQPSTTATENVRMPAEPGAYAAVLYDTLHRVDAGGWEWIGVEPVPQEIQWAGIADRLRRAAQQTRPGTARS
jgi:L-threonylcarbamoyladenylate synthase